MVEILTAGYRRPSRDWLNFVATSRARSNIRHWLNTEQKKEAQAIGRKLLEREFKKLRQSSRKVFEGARMKEYLEAEGLGRLDDLFQRIGYGRVAVKHVVGRLVDQAQLTEASTEKSGAIRRVVDRALGQGPVLVRGEGDLMANLAKCCEPVPGENLIGYITRGRGISVHSVDCPNVTSLGYDPERLVEVEWARQGDTLYPVTISVETEDQSGMLAKLTEVIAKESNIRMCDADTRTGLGLIDFVVEVRNQRHFDRLCQKIQGVKGVRSVERRRAGTVLDPRKYS